MDSQQQRIVDELAGVFEGELRFDALSRSIYATDASLYQMTPLGVAFPRHRDDVISLARYAAEHSIPLISRGAGSGLAGGAIGAGLIVDFSRHLNRIVEVGEDFVRVEPGVVRDSLNRVLREQGRYFPPDPSNTAISTIGGMMGVDSAGSHAVRVGSTRDHVRSIELVLMGGMSFEAGLERLVPSSPLDLPVSVNPGFDEYGRPSSDGSTEHNAAVKRAIVSRVQGLLETHQPLIRKHQPPLLRNCAGYHLRSVLSEERVDLPRLLIGSEGTLGMFTAATLHTAPIPRRGDRAAAVRADGIGTQRGAFHRPVAAQPVICSIDGCCRFRERPTDVSRSSFPTRPKQSVVVEQTGYNTRQAQDRIRMVIDAATQVDSSVLIAAHAYEPDDIDFLWLLSQQVVPNLTRLIGFTRPQPFVEDIAVPPESLRDFLTLVHRVLQKHGVTASMYAHAASGQVHLRPFLPMPTSADGSRIEGLARDCTTSPSL